MPPTSAAMELKVLISVLQSGNALKTLLGQVNQLSSALTTLQSKSNGAQPPGIPPTLKPRADEATKSLLNIEGAANKVTNALKFMVGGFLALESVRFVKDLADAAARAEVLQTVLHVVGNNAGYMRTELDAADKAVQKLGITASASRQALTQAIQAGIPLADVTKLARAAQDTAVILGTNSSEAFQRLVTAVQTSNTLMLRHMGITVQAQAAYDRFALSIGKTASQLTAHERVLAFSNATLREAAKLQGTYEAAMGNVGKQLTSLDRLQENLKVSLGAGLLPAYSALVEELSEFLKYLGLTTDEMGGQTKAARDLGATIKDLAHSFFEIGKFLIEHKGVVLGVIEAYFVFTRVLPWIRSLVAALPALEAAIAGVAGGGAGLVAALGGWPVIIAGVIAILVALAAQFPTVRAGLLSVWYAFLTVLTVIGAVAKAIFGLIPLLNTLNDVLIHPWRAADLAAAWKQWEDTAKQSMDEVVAYAKKTQEQVGKALTPETPEQAAAREKQAREDDIAKGRVEIAKLMAQEADAKERLEKAQTLGGGSKVTDLEEALKRVREELGKAQAAQDKLYGAGGYSPESIEREKKMVAVLAEEQKARYDMEGIEEARSKSRFTYGAEGELSRSFGLQIGQYSELLNGYVNKTKDANVTTAELTTNLEEAGKAAQTAGDLKLLTAAVNDLLKSNKELSAEERSRVRSALTTGRLQVEQATLARTNEIFQRQQALRNEANKQTDQQLQLELTQLQTHNAQTQALEDQAYARGAISLQDYYDHRAAIIEAEYQKQKQVAETDLQQAITRPVRNVQEEAARATEVQAARNRLAKLEDDTEGKRQENRIKRDQERTSINNEILDIQREIAEYEGDEATVLEVLNAKYQDRLNRLKDSKPEARELLRIQQTIEEFDIARENREKRAQPIFDELAARKQTLDLEQKQADLEKIRVDALEKSGNLTATQAARARNQLLQQQEQRVYQQGLNEANKLRQTSIRLAEEEAAKRKELESIGVKDSGQMELLLSQDKAIIKLREDFRQGKIAVQDFENQMAALATQIERSGDQIRKAFQDGLGKAINDSIYGIKKLGETWGTFLVDFSKSVTGMITGDIAARITNAINRIGAKTDKGNVVPGTGLFERFLPPWLRTAPKRDGSSPGMSLYVDFANPEKLFNYLKPTAIGEQPQLNFSPKTNQQFNFLMAGVSSASTSFSQFAPLANLGANLAPHLLRMFSTRAPVFEGGSTLAANLGGAGALTGFEEGGPVQGPGTGTSDSILARVSAGEHIMPAAKAARWMPLLESIRLGTLAPAFALGGVVALQSIAMSPVIPRRYASGGVVVTDGGASAVETGGGAGNMVVSLHPDALNLTMREWLEHEVVRQQGRR